jgi:hypothetical protein
MSFAPGVSHPLRQIKKIVYMYVRKEAVLSSQIEGTQSSLQDLLAAGALILGDPAFKRYYRIGELAAMWQLGCETVRLLVKDERGVIKIRLGRGSCCGEPARGAGPRACDGRAG